MNNNTSFVTLSRNRLEATRGGHPVVWLVANTVARVGARTLVRHGYETVGRFLSRVNLASLIP